MDPKLYCRKATSLGVTVESSRVLGDVISGITTFIESHGIGMNLDRSALGLLSLLKTNKALQSCTICCSSMASQPNSFGSFTGTRVEGKRG